ncbi:sensor domain-containing diguanylate cyclase [Teichococcus aestuarii]|uniref:sensor domain-containing diguanylate cyclase n=1 Tax=Teichococcus aestuarii TaxID=568898 RepID=UPI0015E82237|nr:diguanylate cyclase [Pseudoroseomonas aestuarii]
MRLLLPFKAQASRLHGAAGSLPLRMAAFGMLACLALLGVETLNSVRARAEQLQKAEASVTSLARALVQHADDMLSLADVMLVSLVETARSEGLQLPALGRLNLLLERRATMLQRGLRFSIHGPDGALLATSHPGADAGPAERDEFLHQGAAGGGVAYLGLPVRDRASGAWMLTLSRRIEGPDGSLAGVAVATIETAHFVAHYAWLGLGPQSTVALFRDDGTVLVRHPPRDDLIGRRRLRQDILQSGKDGPEKPDRYISPIDGVKRIGAFHRAENHPILLVVSLSVENVLTGWRNDLAKRAMITGGLILLLAFLGVRLTRSALERHRVAQALAESEASFRSLAENSSDVAMRVDMQCIIRYVSPGIQPWLGWQPQQIAGQFMPNLVAAEDRGTMQATLLRMVSEGLPPTRHTLRLHRRDGALVWAELALHPMRDPRTGRPDGAVIVARDIGEHKAREAQLHRLASTDGLTGLANRRAFDETLEREWRRMVRGDGALSLLLLDVDRFKPFNDRHGHPQGDCCLKAVADALSTLARRPADLAARYGGEEMVLLLPDTDSAGAARMAEAARAAIEGLQWPHEDNTPFRVVTVSIGVATASHGSGLMAAEQLVKAADGALYHAKRNGRNRIVLAEALAERPALPAGGMEDWPPPTRAGQPGQPERG